MTMYNTHEAKTHFSKLLNQVESGEEIIIAKAGKPVAKIVPFESKKSKRRFGSLEGQLIVAEDFDDFLSKEIEQAFYDDEKKGKK